MDGKKEKEQNDSTRKRIPFKRAVKQLLETPPLRKGQKAKEPKTG